MRRISLDCYFGVGRRPVTHGGPGYKCTKPLRRRSKTTAEITNGKYVDARWTTCAKNPYVHPCGELILRINGRIIKPGYHARKPDRGYRKADLDYLSDLARRRELRPVKPSGWPCGG